VMRETLGESGCFDISTLREPFRIEGKKTMGYELAEQGGFDLPDVVISPTGGGTGLIGIWKAFDEMEALGWIGPRRPRMIVVQAEGCAPIVAAFEQGAARARPWPTPETAASGLRVPGSLGDFLILRAVRESGGVALAVADREMMEGSARLARYEGIDASPEGGATLAALERLIHEKKVGVDERVVLLNTGTGLKYFDAEPGVEPG